MSYSTDPDSPKDEAKQNVWLCLVGAVALTAFIFMVLGIVYTFFYL